MNRRVEPGNSCGFALELGGVFNFGTSDQIHRLEIGRACEQHNVAAFDSRRHDRASADTGKH